MNDNIILELREKDSLSLGVPGSFETKLIKPVNVANGDIIQLKSAFIDSREQSTSSIVLENDITVLMKYGVYVNDVIPLLSGTNNGVSYVNLNGSSGTQDFQPCIPYKFTSLGTPPSYSLSTISSWLFNYIPDPFITSTQEFELVLQYNDVKNIQQNIHFSVPSFGKNNQPPNNNNFYYVDLKNLVFVNGSISIVSPLPSQFVEYQVSNGGPQGIVPLPTPGISGLYQPYEFTHTFEISSGTYNASEFALLISKNLSDNQITPPNFSSKETPNQFLKSTSQFKIGKPQPDGTEGNIEQETLFIKNDFSNMFRYNPVIPTPPLPDNTDIYIGASQMTLNYNENSQTFEWTYLHTPYYDSVSGNTPVVKYVKNSVNNFATISNLGGIYFTQLLAYTDYGKSTQKFFDLWSNILGFNVGDITCNKIVFDHVNVFGKGPSTIFNQLEPLQYGKTIINQFVGIDSSILKQQSKWFYNQKDVFESEIDLSETNKISALVPLPVLLDKFSHYLIEIQAGFYNQLLGTDSFRTINGIVSKYYGYSTYTFDGGEGAIEYQHKGSEYQLKSVRVRILRSDKTTNINGLGDDNTFYLQILKQPPQKPAITN